MRDLVEVRAPATSANLGAGFDVFGVALDVLNDSVTIEKNNLNKITIQVEGKGADFIPLDPDRNTAGIVAKHAMKLSGKNYGLNIIILKGIMPASGLGSSGASAAATAIAMNEMLELGLNNMQLIALAAEGEKASAGVPHADNVSAAIIGFFTIIKSYNPLEVIQMLPPPYLEFVIALPDIRLSTQLARTVLPKQISLDQMIKNIGNASSFIAGISLNDIDLMGRSMLDYVIEPARSKLIPGFHSVRKEALMAGASGVAISGAGPSIISIIDSNKVKAEEVAKALRRGFSQNDIDSMTFCCKPGPGARVVKKR